MGKQDRWSNQKEVLEKSGPSTIRRLRSFPAERIFDSLSVLKSAEILKATPTTTVYKVSTPSSSDTSLCVKKYTYPSLLSRLKALTGSRPYRAWAAGYHLRALGIPVIEVCAFMRTGTPPHTDYLFVTCLDHAVTLYDYARTIGTKSPAQREARKIVSALAHALALMHQREVYHNDLKGQNVLIDCRDSSTPQCVFCDLDSIMLWRKLSFRRIAKNLAQLNTSLPEHIAPFVRIRFFLIYLQLMDHAGKPLQKRSLLNRVAAISRKRRARHRKRQKRKRQQVPD